MKKIFFAVLIFLTVLAIVLIIHQKQLQLKTLKVGNAIVLVELAQTEKEKEQGLSDQEFLCENCGLLFVYDQTGIYTFWMRRMYFDIDILWIADSRVVDITYNATKPSTEEFEAPKTLYSPKFPADKVLEVNAGWAQRNGIKIGDVVKY